MKINPRVYTILWLVAAVIILPLSACFLRKCWLAEFASVPTTYALAVPLTKTFRIGNETIEVNCYSEVDPTLFIQTNKLAPELRKIRWGLQFQSWSTCELQYIIIRSAERISIGASYDGANEESYLFIKENNAWKKLKTRR